MIIAFAAIGVMLWKVAEIEEQTLRETGGQPAESTEEMFEINRLIAEELEQMTFLVGERFYIQLARSNKDPNSENMSDYAML